MIYCLQERYRLTALRALSSFSIIVLLRLVQASRANAEGRADVKYENYTEEHGRISVQTTAALFDVSLTSSLSARASVVLDSISGATPTGVAAIDANNVPLPDNRLPDNLKDGRYWSNIQDRRRAVSLEVSQRWGLWTVSPQLSHSQESDYESWGMALNQTFEFNEKNTTLQLGVSHDADRVLDAEPLKARKYHHKETTDVFVGVTQLLSPTTVLTVNLTVGNSSGFLKDPYKRIAFAQHFPDANNPNFAEIRPGHKLREVGFVGLTQFVTPLNGSADVSYRIHHDSFGIWSHTGEFKWLQKIGQRVVLEPSIRYYRQSAANFYYYYLNFDKGDVGVPDVYSADYRLSNFHAWTYGIKASVRVWENFSLELGYKRYEMIGDDNFTAANAYPRADVYTVGGTLWF